MIDDETMTIREMCDAFSVTPRALRFYESKELLFPIREGQKRLFTKRDRARLKLILRGKRFGISLEDIRQVLDMYDAHGAEAQLVRARDLGRRRLAEMEAQRVELDSAIAELKEKLSDADARLAGTGRAHAAA